MLQFFGVVVCEYPNGEDGDSGNNVQGADMGDHTSDLGRVGDHNEGGQCVRNHFAGFVDSAGQPVLVRCVTVFVMQAIQAKRERKCCEQSDENSHFADLLCSDNPNCFRLSDLARKAPVSRTKLPPQGP